MVQFTKNVRGIQGFNFIQSDNDTRFRRPEEEAQGTKSKAQGMSKIE
jgi:hypothetical protein